MVNIKPARVAVLGIAIECHRRAPALSASELQGGAMRRGAAVLELLNLGSAYGFSTRLSSLRAWEPVPILLVGDTAGGPLEHRDYLLLRDEIESGLRDAGPLDAVYIDAHGAGLTTVLDDMDGDYFETVRRAVGDIPIVATLDLHGKVSERMFVNADAMIAMHTNPHIDLPARRDDAAVLLHRLLEGRGLHGARVRVPMITPQVAQLTKPGAPLGRLMALARDVEGAGEAIVSLLPGFAFSDTAENGFSVCAYSWVSTQHARQITERLAEAIWRSRDQFSTTLLSLAFATQIAVAAGTGEHRGPVILADVSDNPGGGGRGNTVHVLRSLLLAGADRAVVGPVHDPLLVQHACQVGLGRGLIAGFNSNGQDPESGTLRWPARVVALEARTFRPAYGVTKGLPCTLGQTCVLQCGGIQVAVSSRREQTYSVDYLEACGVRLSDVATFVVKSRGHFRAGFAHLVPDELVFEVDAPGLTTPNLNLVPWRGLCRPIYPLDPDMQWAAAHTASV